MSERTPEASQKWARRLGWGLLLGATFLLLVIPLDFSTTNLSGNGILLLYGLLLLSHLAAVTLLIVAYRRFFSRPWGILLFAGLLTLGVATSGASLADTAGAPLRRLILIANVWGLIAMIALGIAVLVYLVYRDRSVSLAMFTFLALIWTLVFYISQQGPAQLLQNVLSGVTIGTVSPLPSLFCLAFWVVLIAPLSFAGHTVLLLYREWKGDA